MRTARTLLGAIMLFVGLLPQMAGACVSAYMDFNVDTAQGEVEAWAWVEDYYNSSPCFDEAYWAWQYWEHTYDATVYIESPTQNSAYDHDGQSNVFYGGGSASAYAYLSVQSDPGIYSIDLEYWIYCLIGGYFIADIGNYSVEVPLYTSYDEWPTDECGISGDDYSPSHRGKDLNASAYGTVVRAMEDATVTFVKDDGAHLGSENFVVLRGSDGIYTIYVHVTASVEVNDTVSAGDTIGVTDNTGNPTGPHAHICRSETQSCSGGVDYELPTCPL